MATNPLTSSEEEKPSKHGKCWHQGSARGENSYITVHRKCGHDTCGIRLPRLTCHLGLPPRLSTSASISSGDSPCKGIVRIASYQPCSLSHLQRGEASSWF
eukprot:1157690-Pelagomonas_calceolata.AAC.9